MSDFTSWYGADTFLKGGRSKTSRRLSRNRYVARQADGSISLVLHYTAIVTYHQDGTFTLFHDGWTTVTTARHINGYTPFRIGSSYDRRYPGWQIGWTGERTPSRKQKCRTCKGEGGSVERKRCYGAPRSRWGGDKVTCDGQTTLYGVPYELTAEGSNWKQHKASGYTVPCEHGPAFDSPHRITLCEHGSRHSHEYGDIFETACHRCDGEGVAEYGDKPIPLIWPGCKAVRLAADGTVLDLDAPRYSAPSYKSTFKATYHHVGNIVTPYKHQLGSQAKHELGSQAKDVLEAALPALHTVIWCPACKDGERHSQSISALVIHLNDTKDWSREQIADWLDTLDADLRFPLPKEIAA